MSVAALLISVALALLFAGVCVLFLRSWLVPGETFDLTFDLLQRELDDIVTLTEAELAEGVRLALRTTHNLAEGAGAAAIAAAMKLRDRLGGQTVACVMSGGNIDRAKLERILMNGARAASN